MKLHVLPGDATAETFHASKIDGEVAICREALIEGDVSGETLSEFWNNRSGFLEATHGESAESYMAKVAAEFEKLLSASAGDSVFLWFEFELFCQANYWFCLSLVKGTAAAVFRVSPIVRDGADKWKGFGQLNADDFRSCLAAAVQLNPNDIERGAALWEAFRSGDADRLRTLAEPDGGAFPVIGETVEAAIAKDERPQAILRDIIDEGVDGFDQIFKEFSKRAGVYGFGDSQVRRVLDSL